MAFSFNPEAYGPCFAEILREQRVMDLGPGAPNRGAEVLLKNLDVRSAFSHTSIRNEEMAKACLAAVWLYHDFLDESHRISQSIPSTTGSYWHGIMHRREPDSSNSKYWFRKVGQHPIFNRLFEHVRELPDAGNLSLLAGWTEWDPFRFIDFCQKHYRQGDAGEEFGKAIQLKEWQVLFDYSYANAVVKPVDDRPDS